MSNSPHKSWLIGIFGILVVLGIAYLALTRNAVPPQQAIADYKNIAYEIEGQSVLLQNGLAETEIAPGSASKLTTKYFGNDAVGDLNSDGIPDIAFLLTQSGGGSGTFFYAVAALQTPAGYQGTNGVLLGDRVAPQTTQIQNGTIVVNYADRKPNEPMAAQPSVGVSKYLHIVSGKLEEATFALFTCNAQKSIRAIFYPKNDTHVDLTLSDGRVLSVPHAISASGARYANADESFVFWDKGNTAFIEEAGATTFSGCVTR